MRKPDHKEGVWFVYDGQCPLCSSAAYALRIKKEHGFLHLIDARLGADDPLVDEINQRGFDLDEGMVIFTQGRFYHGRDALKFMAQYSEVRNAFTLFCKSLFWSHTLTTLTYPWMRGVRNMLLRSRGVERIDNLDLKNQPIFQDVFGESWADLPPVMHKHYANRAYSGDTTIVEGTLDVSCKRSLQILAPIMKLMGQIPVRNEKNVQVTVRFQSDLDTKSFQFNRVFHFKGTRPYVFRSRMVQIKGNEVIEIMRFGLGWKMEYLWDGEKVILQHKGYALHLFGHFIAMPLTFIMGEGYAEEIAIDDNTFDMITHITHPWWGKIYEYKGRFKVIKEP